MCPTNKVFLYKLLRNDNMLNNKQNDWKNKGGLCLCNQEMSLEVPSSFCLKKNETVTPLQCEKAREVQAINTELIISKQINKSGNH